MANIFVRDSASLEKDGAAHQEHISMAKEQHGELTPEELVIEKKLRRKIDLRILPLIILVYVMNYIDRYGKKLLAASPRWPPSALKLTAT